MDEGVPPGFGNKAELPLTDWGEQAPVDGTEQSVEDGGKPGAPADEYGEEPVY